jgi:hypothetical protein
VSAATDQCRLAVIMLTDMVGYSAVAQRNDKLALEFLEDLDPMLWWNQDQLYDSVRNEPRFQAIMQKVDRMKAGAKP